MNVKEVIGLLKSAKKITVGYGAEYVAMHMDDELMIDAYSRYRVAEIRALSAEVDAYELTIAMQPIMEGA